MFGKKKKKVIDIILPEKPRVLGASMINYVSCEHCKSVYQPMHHHLEFYPEDFNSRNPKQSGYAKCPLCGQPNKVTFVRPTVWNLQFEEYLDIIERLEKDDEKFKKVKEVYNILSKVVYTDEEVSAACDILKTVVEGEEND